MRERSVFIKIFLICGKRKFLVKCKQMVVGTVRV